MREQCLLRLEKSQKREGDVVKKQMLMTSMVMLGAALLFAGCVTGEKPEDAVQKQLEAFKAGMLAEDIDAIMAPFSESFSHYEWGDKAGARDFLSQAIDMGYLEGLEVNIENAEKKIEGDTASVYPIEISGPFGSVTLELIFTKEAGGWMITGLDASGI